MSGSEFVNDAFIYASFALLGYDTLLTFSREVQHVWTRKAGLVTVVFILQRWIRLLDGVIDQQTPVDVTSKFRCMGLVISDYCLVVLGFMGTAAFSTLRIWAIWGHARIPALCVLLVSAVTPSLYIYDYSRPTHFDFEDGQCYVLSDFLGTTLYNRIVAELLVLALTWVKTADVWRESLKVKGFKPSLTTLLLRDGTVYFSLLLILNIVVLVLDAIQFGLLGGTSFVYILDAVSANLTARFILDLRNVYVEQSHPHHDMSTIQFGVQSIAGNIGAPLRIEDSTWLSSPADDITDDNEDGYERAVLPLRAGLGLETEEVGLDTVLIGQDARIDGGIAERS
ncbi:hypothetical protein EIP91_002809 [Steccherinum ochraceum]|uniref:DUF6533 domain-containing protein n=1 Tax=Steccherinum ochraceum TaxID=92696 RepID=A0A4R0RF19_9APHY|nr:hypothetical protein EIP91_002809 [Steccherinum ochraceum]